MLFLKKSENGKEKYTHYKTKVKNLLIKEKYIEVSHTVEYYHHQRLHTAHMDKFLRTK